MNQLINDKGKWFTNLIWPFWLPLLFCFAYQMTHRYRVVQEPYPIGIFMLFMMLLCSLLLGIDRISLQIEKRDLYRKGAFFRILIQFLLGFLLPLSGSLIVLVLLDLYLKNDRSNSRQFHEHICILIAFFYLINTFYLIVYTGRKGPEKLNSHQVSPKRLFVQHQGCIMPVSLMDIALIYQEHQINWLVNFEGQHYIMEISLKQVQAVLDSHGFFQINRRQIVNRENIMSLKSGTFGKIEVKFIINQMKGTVSKGRAREFRKWLCF